MGRQKVYVIQVLGGHEEQARRALERAMGELARDCFTPLCTLRKKVRGEWRDTSSLLFSGYVFVQTAEPRVLLEASRKVGVLSRMLGVSGDSFKALSEDEVAWLDAVTGGETHIVGMSTAVQEGDRIVVTDGPLRGQEALIQKVDRHKRVAYLRIHILGRDTRVRVGLEVVSKRG